jgi:MFS family permease
MTSDLTEAQANRYKIFTVGAIGTFMATLDGSIVNVGLPTIARELNCSVDLVAWVALAYSLTLVSLLLVYGAWTERKGFAFAYTYGFILFMLGSAACGLSPNIYSLIGARVLQASGTAVFASIGPAMVTAVFPEKERGKGIGMMVMMVAAGFTVGPPLGGLLLGVWDWPSIFYVNIPIGIVGLGLAIKYLRTLTPPKVTRAMPLKGAMAVSLGLVSTMLAMSLVDGKCQCTLCSATNFAVLHLVNQSDA